MNHRVRWWPPSHWYQLRIPERIWWHWMPGITVSLPWPSGWVVLHDDSQGGQTSVDSADPNDHYRPWIEANIGRQGWDWQWRPRLGTTMITPGYETEDALGDRVEVKVRHRHEKQAMLMILRWA